MKEPHGPSRWLAPPFVIGAFVLLAAFVSWFQVFSESQVSKLELWGRLVWFAAFGAIYLAGRIWARWVLTISGVGYCIWFVRSATQQPMLLWRIVLGAAALAQIAAVVALLGDARRRLQASIAAQGA